jgi:AcrR family transcriptional regulator
MTTNQQRRRARKLQSIKDATLALIAEDGIDAFSVHRLAERLDLTVGALYRYFASVDELLSAVQIDILEGIDRYLADVVGRLAAAAPLERLVAICYAYLALEVLQPERFRLIARFVSSPDPVLDTDVARSAMELTRRLLGRLATIINEAQRTGSLTVGNAFDRSILAWSSLQGLAERRKLARLEPDLFNPERLTRELLRSLLLGWGANGQTVEHVLDSAPDRTFFELSLHDLES